MYYFAIIYTVGNSFSILRLTFFILDNKKVLVRHSKNLKLWNRFHLSPLYHYALIPLVTWFWYVGSTSLIFHSVFAYKKNICYFVFRTIGKTHSVPAARSQSLTRKNCHFYVWPPLDLHLLMKQFSKKMDRGVHNMSFLRS